MRYTVLTKPTGEVLVIDNVKVRLQNMRRRVSAWAKVMASCMKPGYNRTMYGLTYDTEGTLVRAAFWQENDIREFINRLKARLGDRLKAYAWVAEKQARGVLHYHVVIIHTGRAPMPDRRYVTKNMRGQVRQFERLWRKGNSHTDFHVRSPYYLVSYLKKEYQKDFEHFPKGAHAWAVWVSDETAKQALMIGSLRDFQRMTYLEVAEENEGLSFRECWDRFEWELRRQKLAELVTGKGWVYLGQVQSAEQLKGWGVTDEQLQEKMYTRITRGTC